VQRDLEGRAQSYTDLWNAERFVVQHRANIRFAPEIGRLAWDGRRWRRDVDGAWMRCAKNTVKSMYAEAATSRDSERLAKHAVASASEARLRAMTSLAESELDVLVSPRDLDSDPWLFNVKNGTVDLRMGELREHRREDLITRITNVEYVPDADSNIWDDAIDRVTGSDPDLAAFLQRAYGYSLTGHTYEHKLFFAHGPGATGKTTTLEAMRLVLGEYSMTADFETFLKRRGDAGVRNDIARLAGARLVISLEVDEGKQLAEGLIKVVTGGDTVTARFLYGEAFEFRPAFKLWLAANTRPRVNATDTAMRRRILEVPFVQVIPEAERDERITIALRTDPAVQSAILAWGIRGCLQWQDEGLNPPDTVINYTNEYFASHDPLLDWLSDTCNAAADGWTPTATLRASYQAWCEDNGETAINSKQFKTHLEGKGFREHRTKSARGWLGITVTGDTK
jgi:putative DNA primase/helicase